MRWVSPAGVTGLMPLASVGPISLGASPVEHSTARVERLLVGVDLLQSLLQGRIILTTRAVGAEVCACARSEPWRVRIACVPAWLDNWVRSSAVLAVAPGAVLQLQLVWLPR